MTIHNCDIYTYHVTAHSISCCCNESRTEFLELLCSLQSLGSNVTKEENYLVSFIFVSKLEEMNN